MISDIVLDHVAIAVERHAQAFPRYVSELGGRWLGGGFGSGFAPEQIGFAGGIRLEILAPHRVEDNDFLRRFLDRTGPGPHHLTFKVDDIEAALAEAESAGYPAIGVDVSDPRWKEAFLHPKDASGVVIQLAQAAEQNFEGGRPEGFPPNRAAANPATLVHVAHAVADLDGGLRLFAGLLGGTEAARGEDRGSRWIDLTWPGPGRVRLLAPDSTSSPLLEWVADRTGRLHHLAFMFDDPSCLSGASARRDGVWEVPPADNLGVRLLVCLPSPSAWFPAADQGNN